MMARHGPKLEKRQALLFRAVDIGADLFAMSATLSRAQAMRRGRDADAARAAELADVFCRMTRRRIAQRFAAIRSNDDVRKYKTARRLLAGEHLWLERGLVPTDELEKFASAAAEATEKELASVCRRLGGVECLQTRDSLQDSVSARARFFRRSAPEEWERSTRLVTSPRPRHRYQRSSPRSSPPTGEVEALRTGARAASALSPNIVTVYDGNDRIGFTWPSIDRRQHAA